MFSAAVAPGVAGCDPQRSLSAASAANSSANENPGAVCGSCVPLIVKFGAWPTAPRARTPPLSVPPLPPGLPPWKFAPVTTVGGPSPGAGPTEMASSVTSPAAAIRPLTLVAEPFEASNVPWENTVKSAAAPRDPQPACAAAVDAARRGSVGDPIAAAVATSVTTMPPLSSRAWPTGRLYSPSGCLSDSMSRNPDRLRSQVRAANGAATTPGDHRAAQRDQRGAQPSDEPGAPGP